MYLLGMQMYALSAVSTINGRICKSNITLMEWKHYIAPNFAKIVGIKKRGQDKTFCRYPVTDDYIIQYLI